MQFSEFLPWIVTLLCIAALAYATIFRSAKAPPAATGDAAAQAAKFEALAAERGEASDKLRADLDAERGKNRELSDRIARLEAELENEKTASAEKIEMLGKLREGMQSEFGDLARKALAVQGEEFSKANLEKLDGALTPLKEHVERFQKELKAAREAAIGEHASLVKEISLLTERSEKISLEARDLTRALKSDSQKQGAWGELILENLLENSGLRKGEDYETQPHRTGEEGERLRPDVIVNLPGGKTLVIDSKVSLSAYTDLVNAPDDDAAQAALARHLQSLKGHIGGLADRDYQSAEERSVDYVIMFVPIEGALSEALRADGQLTEFALKHNIAIATPTTLMMALRTVAQVWAVERRNRNAEKIAKRAGLLHDKVAGFVDSMNDVGKALEQARKSYDTAFDRLSRGRGNLLSQVEKLKDLGAAATKSIAADTGEHDDGDESDAALPEPDSADD